LEHCHLFWVQVARGEEAPGLLLELAEAAEVLALEAAVVAELLAAAALVGEQAQVVQLSVLRPASLLPVLLTLRPDHHQALRQLY